VYDIDVNLAGLDENTEEETGLYLAWNDDDDNSDTTLDYQEHPVSGENDVSNTVTISASPSDLPNPLTFSWDGKVKLWENSNKDTQITQTQYAASQLPKTYQVEGYSPSSSLKDTEIKLTYTAPDNSVGEDKAKVTVFTLDSVKLYYHSLDEFPFTDTEVMIKAVATMKSGDTYQTSAPALTNDGNWYYNFPAGGATLWQGIWGSPSFNWKNVTHTVLDQCTVYETTIAQQQYERGQARWYGYNWSSSSITGWGTTTTLSEGVHRYKTIMILVGTKDLRIKKMP